VEGYVLQNSNGDKYIGSTENAESIIIHSGDKEFAATEGYFQGSLMIVIGVILLLLAREAIRFYRGIKDSG